MLSMLSGPAAGVIAAAHVGSAAGYPDLITCDMGGTSTDVCLVRGGAYGMTTEGRVGAFPIKIRQIDINSIGVGGGSIAALGSRRLSDCRPALGRRRAGPLLLRPRRHRADHHRRQRGAGTPRRASARSAERSRSIAARRSPPSPGLRRSVGLGAVEMAEGISAHCRRLAGRRDQGGVGDARHRSARLRAACRSAAPVRCMPQPSPTSSACAPWSCRRCPAISPRWAC